MKIAVCSPNADSYSETFIRAHRDLLKEEVLFYRTGFMPQYLGKDQLMPGKYSLKSIYRLFKRFIGSSLFSIQEYNFCDSLKKNRPDVVLAEYGPTAVAVLPVVKFLQIPLVVHFHGADATAKEILELYGEKYNGVFQYASSVIAVSGVMIQKLTGLGCPAFKIVKTCCGPNQQFFELKPVYSVPVFLGVGRFVDKKAPYSTILAFNEVVKEFPDAKLRMAGDGPLKAVCEDLVRYLKLGNNVFFLGVLSHEEVMNEMLKAIVFVQHSKTAVNGDMEGTPVGILEAQAAALPVISTLHAGIPEVVIHGQTGFLVEENDIHGMAEYMIRLLNSAVEVKNMGVEGRKRVKEYFTIDMHIETIQGALNKAVV
jgi:colanic acid/amylovoran biosynthesis glycosyltransferase